MLEQSQNKVVFQQFVLVLNTGKIMICYVVELIDNNNELSLSVRVVVLHY